MIATSTILMFGLMYLNTYAFDHLLDSQTRSWMALMMGAAMSIVMLGFMWKMYRNPVVSWSVLAAAAAVFALALWLVRSQAMVSDVAYMKAMIPHHSIAVLTSQRAHIRDARVRQLADKIIAAQVREIAEMKQLINDIERRPNPGRRA